MIKKSFLNNAIVVRACRLGFLWMIPFLVGLMPLNTEKCFAEETTQEQTPKVSAPQEMKSQPFKKNRKSSAKLRKKKAFFKGRKKQPDLQSGDFLELSGTEEVSLEPAVLEGMAGNDKLQEGKQSESSDAAETVDKEAPLHSFYGALGHAYINSGGIKSKVEEQKIRAESVASAKSGWRPTVSASTTHTRGRSRTPTNSAEIPTTTNSTSNITNSVKVEQNIFQGGGTYYGIESARHGVHAGWADYMKTEQDTLFNSAEAYLSLLTALEELKLNHSKENRLREGLKSIVARVEAGELSRTDRAQAEANYAKAVADRIAAEGAVEVAKATYVKTGSGQPNLSALSAPELPRHLLPSTLEEAAQIALDDNPTVRNASLQWEASKSNAKVKRASLLPTVDLSGDASHVRDDTNNTHLGGGKVKTKRGSVSAAVTLKVPLYQRGAEWASLREAHKTAAKGRADLGVARTATKEAIFQAWERWMTAKKQIGEFRAQVKAAVVSLKGIQQEFAVGERTLLEVISAENELLSAQVSEVKAMNSEKLEVCRVLNALGRFTHKNLNLTVPPHNVERFIKDVENQWIGL